MKYYCEHCNKEYKSYQSLWNHNKKFHNIEKSKKVIESHKPVINSHIVVITNTPDHLSCKYCNKTFQNSSNRLRHEKGYCKTREQIKEEKEKDRLLEEQRLEVELKNKEVEALKVKLKL